MDTPETKKVIVSPIRVSFFVLFPRRVADNICLRRLHLSGSRRVSFVKECEMKLLRWTLVVCLIVGFAGLGITSSNRAFAARLADASNKDKIIGVWEITKGGETVPKGALFEFTKDGKLKMTFKIEDRTINLEATYKVEEDKLKTAMTGPGGKKVEDTDTIEKLTDTAMVLKDSKGKVVEFKKKKKDK